MGGRVLQVVSVMWAWCFLCGGRTMTTVGAEATASAWIVTPEADRLKEGGRVEMRCVATNLEANHTVEWRTENPILTLRWGNSTLGGTNGRFQFQTLQTGAREITQDFNITNLQRSDDDEYICIVNDPIQGGGHDIVASSSVRLDRVYPSSESFPVCSPHGPVTVDNGTQMTLTCSADTGNPSITIALVPPMPNSYPWVHSVIAGRAIASLDLTLDATTDNVTFNCSIPSVTYSDLTHYCVIGPIIVMGPDNGMSTTTATLSTTAGDKAVPSTSSDGTNPTPEPDSNLALVAGASAGGVASLVLVFLLILVCRRRGLCAPKPKPQRHDGDFNTIMAFAHRDSDAVHAYDNRGPRGLGNRGADGVNVPQDPRDAYMYANPREGPITSIAINSPGLATGYDEAAAPSVYDRLQQRQLPGPGGRSDDGAGDVSICQGARDMPEYAKPGVHLPVSPPSHQTRARSTGPDESATLPVYARPHKTPKQGHLGVDSPAPLQSEQRYSDPAGESTITGTDADMLVDDTPRRPTAKVPPMPKVPTKPPAYVPKPRGVRDPGDGSPVHPPVPQGAAVERGHGEPHPPPSEEVSYARISKAGPNHQDPTPDQSITYADLALQSDSSDGDWDRQGESVLYAEVKI